MPEWEKAPGEPAPAAWFESPLGYRIPVREYGANGKRRPVVVVHGLQSHSGWFVRSARRLERLGMPVFAFDRCGSGISRAHCDPGPRLEQLLAEIEAVAERALARTGHDSFHLLGHCFGSIPAVLFAARQPPGRVASLVLAVPALQTRTRPPLLDRLRILASLVTRRDAAIPVPMEADQFSEQPEYVAFVREDPLSLRAVPARFLWEIWRAQRVLPEAIRALDLPLMAAFAAEDTICDNEVGQRLISEAPTPIELHVYPGARHILEFSGQAGPFLDDLAAWYEFREVGWRA